MADTLSAEQRSILMSKVHGQETEIEKLVRSSLHRRGYRFRKNVVTLPGRPDIVLPKYKAAIFVHGCFWHGHSSCRKSHLPTTRRAFWEEKRQANLERDARKVSELIGSGWRVAVVWQCVLEQTKTLSSTMNILEDWINSEKSRCEIPNRIEMPQNQQDNSITR